MEQVVVQFGNLARDHRRLEGIAGFPVDRSEDALYMEVNLRAHHLFYVHLKKKCGQIGELFYCPQCGFRHTAWRHYCKNKLHSHERIEIQLDPTHAFLWALGIQRAIDAVAGEDYRLMSLSEALQKAFAFVKVADLALRETERMLSKRSGHMTHSQLRTLINGPYEDDIRVSAAVHLAIGATGQEVAEELLKRFLPRKLRRLLLLWGSK